MLDSVEYPRITIDTEQMAGVPCIRGLRIPVATVVGMVADGMTNPEIVAALPDLTVEDVQEALRYASEAVRERELPLRRAKRDADTTRPHRDQPLTAPVRAW
jgi:uncharacterized protein (DUF433 family)